MTYTPEAAAGGDAPISRGIPRRITDLLIGLLFTGLLGVLVWVALGQIDDVKKEKERNATQEVKITALEQQYKAMLDAVSDLRFELRRESERTNSKLDRLLERLPK